MFPIESLPSNGEGLKSAMTMLHDTMAATAMVEAQQKQQQQVAVAEAMRAG